MRLVFLCDVDIDSVPAGTIFMHPFGICINAGTVIGKRCDIRHGVTIGRRNIRDRSTPEYAIIGNDVFIGCDARILGNVDIGDRVIIGAGITVLKDVPPDTTVTETWK